MSAKIWIDDVRPAPNGYAWIHSVDEAKEAIEFYSMCDGGIDEISLDHDAGIFFSDGGDYIKVLDWMEENGYGNGIKFHLHSQNPVGIENMRRIIEKNNWTMI